MLWCFTRRKTVFFLCILQEQNNSYKKIQKLLTTMGKKKRAVTRTQLMKSFLLLVQRNVYHCECRKPDWIPATLVQVMLKEFFIAFGSRTWHVPYVIYSEKIYLKMNTFWSWVAFLVGQSLHPTQAFLVLKCLRMWAKQVMRLRKQ